MNTSKYPTIIRVLGALDYMARDRMSLYNDFDWSIPAGFLILETLRKAGLVGEFYHPHKMLYVLYLTPYGTRYYDRYFAEEAGE